MAYDDDLRDDTTEQEFNEEDRASRVERANDVDPADVRDDTALRDSVEDADMDDTK